MLKSRLLFSVQTPDTNTRASFTTQLFFSSFLLFFAAPQKARFQHTQIQIPKITEHCSVRTCAQSILLLYSTVYCKFWFNRKIFN